MRRRKTTVEQQLAPVKFIDTTIVSIETVKEDVDTIKLRFSFANKTKFTKELKKWSWEYERWSRKQEGDEVRLITRAGIIRDIS